MVLPFWGKKSYRLYRYGCRVRQPIKAVKLSRYLNTKLLFLCGTLSLKKVAFTSSSNSGIQSEKLIQGRLFPAEIRIDEDPELQAVKVNVVKMVL